jgi:hypothetical protein
MGLRSFVALQEAVVEQCQQAGLVWGRELYLDATKVEANASLDSVKPRFFVEAHLANLFSTEGEERAEEGAQEVSQEEPIPSEHEELPAPSPLPTALSAEEYEALAQQNEERHDWIEQGGKPDREVIRGTYRRMADFVVSTTDPDATIMPIKGQGRHLGYHTHYVVDGGKARIIMAVLVTPSEVMENQPMLDLVWRTRFRWKLWPRQVTGDTTYGTVDNIVALEQQHIHAYVPLPDFDQRTSFYGQREFQYDPEQDVYRCPQGALLHLDKHRYTEGTKAYRAEAATCNACPSKHIARTVSTVDPSDAVSMRSIWSESAPTIRPSRITRPCASAACGWNPYLQRESSGMACGAFACVSFGGSTVKHWCEQPGKM